LVGNARDALGDAEQILLPRGLFPFYFYLLTFIFDL